MRSRAGGITMLKRVAAAIDAGSFGVPQCKYAVVLRTRKQIDLLTSPDRRRAELLVDRGLEVDVVPFEKAARAPKGLIEPAQRRTAIARDKAAGIQPRRFVTLPLHHRQPHQRLGTREVNPPLVEDVLVVERDRHQRHRNLPNSPPRFREKWCFPVGCSMPPGQRAGCYACGSWLPQPRVRSNP